MDHAHLAQQAIDLLKLTSSEAGKAVAKGAVGIAAVGATSLWTWLKGRLANSAAGALHDAKNDPGTAENWDILRGHLVKAMNEDRDKGGTFANELAQIMNVAGDANTSHQIAHIRGNANVMAQAAGQGNQINVSLPRSDG